MFITDLQRRKEVKMINTIISNSIKILKSHDPRRKAIYLSLSFPHTTITNVISILSTNIAPLDKNPKPPLHQDGVTSGCRYRVICADYYSAGR